MIQAVTVAFPTLPCCFIAIVFVWHTTIGTGDRNGLSSTYVNVAIVRSQSHIHASSEIQEWVWVSLRESYYQNQYAKVHKRQGFRPVLLIFLWARLCSLPTHNLYSTWNKTPKIRVKIEPLCVLARLLVCLVRPIFPLHDKLLQADKRPVFLSATGLICALATFLLGPPTYSNLLFCVIVQIIYCLFRVRFLGETLPTTNNVTTASNHCFNMLDQRQENNGIRRIPCLI